MDHAKLRDNPVVVAYFECYDDTNVKCSFEAIEAASADPLVVAVTAQALYVIPLARVPWLAIDKAVLHTVDGSLSFYTHGHVWCRVLPCGDVSAERDVVPFLECPVAHETPYGVRLDGLCAQYSALVEEGLTKLDAYRRRHPRRQEQVRPRVESWEKIRKDIKSLL